MYLFIFALLFHFPPSSYALLFISYCGFISYHFSVYLGFDVIYFSMLLFLVIYFMQDLRMYLGNYVNI